LICSVVSGSHCEGLLSDSVTVEVTPTCIALSLGSPNKICVLIHLMLAWRAG
jgi:hypothetical protein